MTKNRKKKKKTGDFAAVFFHLVGIIMIVVFFLVAAVMLLPRIQGYRTYYVVSGSMEPTIPVDSMIYVKETEPASLEKDMIIAYDNNGVIVTHRITENDTENREIHTKGDMNQVEDMMPISYDRIVGKVAYHIPELGVLGMYLDSFLGKLVFVVFGIVGIVLTCV